jgi:carotenoid cleavage dioxygenase-like enzyme
MEQLTENERSAGFGGQVPHPFRWSQREKRELPVAVSGSLPEWLKGQLMRTAPADFARNGIQIGHWFDGHALMYAFDFGQGVHFRQQLLATDMLAANDRGRNDTAMFGTDMRRSFLRRLFAPVPALTDNTNVNVVPWQGQWLAMTETPHQHMVDKDSLRSLGHYRYEDRLPKHLASSAHPHYEAHKKAMVNVGTVFGPRNELYFYRQSKDGKGRELEGKLALRRAPYLHAFGLTPRHTLLIDHPLRVNASRMLFSDKGFIRHFRWEPEHTTKLWALDRQSGKFQSYECEPLFCFHTVNAFEDGSDIVFDFLAYDDARLIDALYTAALARALPDITPHLVRARLSPGKSDAKLQRLSSVGFEFPQIAYRRCQGQRHRFVWGTALSLREGSYRSEIVKVDGESGDVRRFEDDDITYGEPVFVARPGASDEDDGVLLAVGSHAHEERSRLCVIDARSLAPLARCEIGLSIPLGFHGNYAEQLG